VRRLLAEQIGVHRQQPPRLLIGRAAQHHAIDMRQVPLRLVEARDAAVDDDGNMRHGGLQPIDPIIIERRDVAVFLRRQAVEPGFPGVHDQRIRSRFDHATRQRIERQFRILIVDPDATFHGDRGSHRALHRRDAFGNERRLRHQAGAEPAIPDAIGRAANIEVDLVISAVLADLGCDREVTRIGATKLQGHRMLARIKPKQPRPIAMNDSAGGQHLRIKPRPPRKPPMEHAALPVGPIHHRGTAKFPMIFNHL
jgi:hypothetical protein